MIMKEFEVESKKLPVDTKKVKDIGKIGISDWTFIQYKYRNHLIVGVECNRYLYSNVWSCDATVQISLCSSAAKEPIKKVQNRKRFNDLDDKRLLFKDFLKIDEATGKLWEETEENPKLVFKISITIHSTIGYKETDDDVEKFDQPNEITDVCLTVEGKKVYSTKQALAMHSKYFHKMFYPNQELLSKKDFTLDEDIKYEEFLDLLRQLSPAKRTFDEKNLRHILKLATRFEMWQVIHKVELFLINNKEMKVFDKLKYAGEFKMNRLQERIGGELEKRDIVLMKLQNNFDELSPEIVYFLFDRLVAIVKAEMPPLVNRRIIGNARIRTE